MSLAYLRNRMAGILSPFLRQRDKVVEDAAGKVDREQINITL